MLNIMREIVFFVALQCTQLTRSINNLTTKFLFYCTTNGQHMYIKTSKPFKWKIVFFFLVIPTPSQQRCTQLMHRRDNSKKRTNVPLGKMCVCQSNAQTRIHLRYTSISIASRTTKNYVSNLICKNTKRILFAIG